MKRLIGLCMLTNKRLFNFFLDFYYNLKKLILILFSLITVFLLVDCLRLICFNVLEWIWYKLFGFEELIFVSVDYVYKGVFIIVFLVLEAILVLKIKEGRVSFFNQLILMFFSFLFAMISSFYIWYFQSY